MFAFGWFASISGADIVGGCCWALPSDAGATARAASAGGCDDVGPPLGEFSDHASVMTCALLGGLN